MAELTPVKVQIEVDTSSFLDQLDLSPTLEDALYQRAFRSPSFPGHVERDAMKIRDALPQWFKNRLRWRNYWTALNWSRTSAGGETTFEQPMKLPENALSGLHHISEMVPDPDRDVDDRKPTKALYGAEAFSSGSKCGTHLVMMDIDHEAILLPSSRPGHYHLVVDVECAEEKLMNLLDAAADAGIVEKGYAGVSRRRGEAFLRLPWVRKGMEKDDAMRAAESFLDDVPPTPVEHPF